MEGRWQGQSDSPLTERGIQQSERLRDALDREPLAAIYSSDLGRALTTARIVAETRDVEPTTDARLREIDTGDWTGRLGSEMRREFPDQMRVWMNRPVDHQMPCGETLAEVQARCLPFFHQRMRAHAGETVLVISHGTVMQTILVHALGRPLEDLWVDRTENCQISRLEWTPDNGLRLVELSDRAHLADIGSLNRWAVMDTEAGRIARS